jgi:ADP-heptose:LPS heptosyltransferase
VVTVDTSMAHLAGALGVPCFVMLPALGCDWRWLRDRSDSPWYPSLRLYRQSRPGDWSEVVGRMRADLAAH